MGIIGLTYKKNDFRGERTGWLVVWNMAGLFSMSYIGCHPTNSIIFQDGYFTTNQMGYTSGWWFGTWLDYEFQLGLSSSQLTNSIIFQRGRWPPPTRNDVTGEITGYFMISIHDSWDFREWVLKTHPHIWICHRPGVSEHGGCVLKLTFDNGKIMVITHQHRDTNPYGSSLQ